MSNPMKLRAKKIHAHWPVAWLGFWLTAAIYFGVQRLPFALEYSLVRPQWVAPLGFDVFGRNLATLIPHSALISLIFAAFCGALSLGVSITAGCAIGLGPRWMRLLGERALDFLLAFPPLLLALGWSAVRGPGWSSLLISLLMATVPNFTRFVYVRVRELQTEPYVAAARALGANRFQIATRHLLPHILSLCAIRIPSLFAHAVLAEATLSFIGVGAPIGTDSWGTLLLQGREYLIEAPHISIAVGLPLILTVLALQRLTEPDYNR
ncbi:MAG: ABC transporter permease [Bacteriovoracia bacterium]